MSGYVPQPFDTSTIPLPAELLEMTELLARHNHDVWARRRFDEGWIYGPARNDVEKKHPCLVPYAELPESEKQYDRETALEALKFILAHGYDILPHIGKAIACTEDAAVQKQEQILARLKAAEQAARSQANDGGSAPELPVLELPVLELPVLLQIWGQRSDDAPEWRISPELYRQLGRRFLKVGAAPQAKEVAQAGLAVSLPTIDGLREPLWDNDGELRAILGLALARTGNSDDAQRILQKLKDDGHANEETLGILARTYKDQAFLVPLGGGGGRELLYKSLKLYREAYEQFAGIWTGINVATLEHLLDNRAESETMARRVKSQCLDQLEQLRNQPGAPESTYWHLATLGEACLNLGDLAAAGKAYRQGYSAAPKNFGDLITTRRHARWLLEYSIAHGELKAADAELLDQWLPIPKVVVFSGHLVDRPGRMHSRFPPEMAKRVRETIRQWLLANHALIGYSSAACGSDLLFQQAIQELGGESRIVLPYDTEPFMADCVSFAGTEWTRLFDRVLSRATEVIIASPKRTQHDRLTYDYANLVLHGLATVRTAQLESSDSQPVGLAVWNGQSGDGSGGTESIVRRWQGLGMRVDQIDLSSVGSDDSGPLPVVRNPTVLSGSVLDEESRLLRNSSGAGIIQTEYPAAAADLPADPESAAGDTRIMAMLFGDAVNFSTLDEEQVRRFVQHFMGPIGGIIRSYHAANVVRNTWGDGLYLVFNHVREAGLCALEISKFVRDQIATGSWKQWRLPGDLNVRLALHAGPLFQCIDPITGQMNYTGTHVSRAARLEPKTPPGEVYASEAFAALCATYRVSDFGLEYVRQIKWAKHYGTFPTFVLRERAK